MSADGVSGAFLVGRLEVWKFHRMPLGGYPASREIAYLRDTFTRMSTITVRAGLLVHSAYQAPM